MNIEILDKHHNRKDFECEEPSLTTYIQRQVSQDIRRNLAICFVAIDHDHHVMGYYTLSTESLGRNQIPERYMNRIPRNYNAPVILLGRLARDIKYKGKGLGEELLMDALFRSFSISTQSIGAMAVVVDPVNDFAINFYLKYGFEMLQDSRRMFIPMNIIGKLF